MGLAAVTEANTGDITVKLKAKRSQAIDDVMSDIRAEIKSKEPELDVEFTQVLQDMINDLSNSPEPIQIKLFNDDPALLAQVGDEVATAIKKQAGVVDVLNGIENTVSGPSTTFQINPSVASRLGFTTQEIATDASAVIEGEPATNRLIQNGRPYTIRVRFSDDHRASFDAIENTVLNSATGKSATLGALATIEHNAGEQEIRRENLQRNISVTGRLEGTDLGSGIQRVQAAVAALHLPPSVRIQYGGTYEEQQKSFSELGRVLVLALALVFGVLLTEFRNLSAPVSILTSSILSMSGVVIALLITGTTFNVASFMGLIMVIGIVAKNGILLLDAYQKFREIGMRAKTRHDSGWSPPPPPHLDDGPRGNRRNVAPGLCTRSRLADAATPCHCSDWRPGDLHAALSRRYTGHVSANARGSGRRGRIVREIYARLVA